VATTQKAAPKVAAKSAVKVTPVKKSRRVFPVGVCHQRDAKGNPSCKELIVGKRANLCPPHEKVWQAAARKRYAATRGTKAAPSTEPTLESTLKESVEQARATAAFATPALAAKARQQAAARKAARQGQTA